MRKPTNDCFDQGYFLEDCAATGRNLEYNKVYDQEETNMEYEFFQLPKMTPLSNGNNIEITIEAQYESSYFPSFASTTPELVILEVCQSKSATMNSHSPQSNSLRRKIIVPCKFLKKGYLYLKLKVWITYSLNTYCCKEVRKIESCAMHDSLVTVVSHLIPYTYLTFSMNVWKFRVDLKTTPHLRTTLTKWNWRSREYFIQ